MSLVNFIKAIDRAKYATYNPENPGCSKANPIVIEETEGYVHLEYEILDALLRPVPYRCADYKVVKQQLVHQGDHKLDVLTVNIYSSPIVDIDEEGNFVRGDRVLEGTEEYWFDITAGFDAMAF